MRVATNEVCEDASHVWAWTPVESGDTCQCGRITIEITSAVEPVSWEMSFGDCDVSDGALQ